MAPQNVFFVLSDDFNLILVNMKSMNAIVLGTKKKKREGRRKGQRVRG